MRDFIKAVARVTVKEHEREVPAFECTAQFHGAAAGIMAELVPMLPRITPDLPPRTCRSHCRHSHIRHGVLAIVVITLAALVSIAGVRGWPGALPQAQTQTPPDSKAVHGAEIVQHGGYPELRVDGAPFFIHSAAFFYYRIPRDQWEALLKDYRSLGINTIDIYIPWNWHEPKEGEFDFDGHTNPRRDLRALLSLIAQDGFKLIARPGPEILNEWRHGGYPGWLLDRPEYKMNPEDWIEGRYPPLDALNARDAEAAAQGWLENSTHMTQARAWLAAVGKELAPLTSTRLVRVTSDDSGTAPQKVSGPLLFVQLGDDFAAGRTNRVGPDFWRYVGLLREAIESAGVDVPVFINPTDMRVSAAGSALAKPVGVMGQWYLRPRLTPDTSARIISARDAGELEFFTETLKTQPNFPPVMIEYQAGWYTPGDDDRPLESSPENTLVSSRLLIGNGIHGLNYFPLQDTFSPAGFSVPWANRSYRWDAAFGPDADAQPRMRALERNGQWLDRWGAQVAGSHKRADFGILYTLGACPQDLLSPLDILRVSETVMRIERLGGIALLSSELLDPAFQPVEELLRDPVIFLPVLDPQKPQFQLSDRAQKVIVEYVRRGGTLVVFPSRPAGSILEELWKARPAEPSSAPAAAIRARWKFGEGEVIESSKDFFSWVSLSRSFPEISAQRETGWAVGMLQEFIFAAGARPSVRISGRPPGTSGLIATEIVSNEGTGLLGERKGGQGFLSVTNISEDNSVDTSLELLSPAASARGMRDDYTLIHVNVPPRESLLLPIQTPLCMNDVATAACHDAVVTAGAEYLDAQREGKSLELTFYVPVRAEIRLRLAKKPSHVTLDETNLEATWEVAKNELDFIIPRGQAPNYIREIKIALPYQADVPELEKHEKPMPGGLDGFVWNAMRLPTSQAAFLRTYPPLLVLDSTHQAKVMFTGINRSRKLSRDLAVAVDGPLRGTETYHIPPLRAEVEWIKLRPTGKEAMALPPGPDGLLHGTIQLRSKTETRAIPIVFLQSGDGGMNHYRYDFDRDGADEWVLENAGLRLIVSPESGGQVIALVDKSTGGNLSTNVGLLRDNLSYTENPPGGNELRQRGRYGLFNRPYIAEWQSEKINPALKLHYTAPDVFPSGADLEKTVQFESANTLVVNYRVALHAVKADPTAISNPPPQSFIAVNSFPAAGALDHPTRFCWPVKSATEQSIDSAKSAGREDLIATCEDFMPGGKEIQVPQGTARVEVRTPGRPTMVIEWDCAKACAQMTIEPKNFSALFRLEYPPLIPGAEPSGYQYRIRALGLP